MVGTLKPREVTPQSHTAENPSEGLSRWYASQPVRGRSGPFELFKANFGYREKLRPAWSTGETHVDLCMCV